MEQSFGRGLTAAEKTELSDRWQRGKVRVICIALISARLAFAEIRQERLEAPTRALMPRYDPLSYSLSAQRIRALSNTLPASVLQDDVLPAQNHGNGTRLGPLTLSVFGNESPGAAIP